MEFASLWVARPGEEIKSPYGQGKAIFLLWLPNENYPVKIIGNDRLVCLKQLLQFCLNNNFVSKREIKDKIFSKGQTIYRACASINRATLDICRYYVEDGFISRKELLNMLKDLGNKNGN